MREWKLKKAIDRGEMIFGVGVWSGSPNMVEIIGAFDLDFVWIDTEHTEYGSVAHLCRAADASGIVPFVRVRDNDPILIRQALEAGAEGITVPHCNTKEDAIQAVKSTWYAPGGIRGSCPAVRQFDYMANIELDWAKASKSSDEDRVLCLLIEEKTGLDNIEEIVSVKGVDAVWPGLHDLSMSMGHMGRTDKAIWDAYEKMVAAAKKKGVKIMTSLGQIPGADKDPVAAAKKFYDDGGRIILIDIDLSYMSKGCREAASLSAKIKKEI